MGKREDFGGSGLDTDAIATALFGRPINNDLFAGVTDKGTLTEEALREYERYAVCAMAELAVRAFNAPEGGIDTACAMLYHVIGDTEKVIGNVKDGERVSAADRHAIASHLRVTAFSTRPEIQETLEFMAKLDAKSTRDAGLATGNREQRRAAKRKN